MIETRYYVVYVYIIIHESACLLDELVILYQQWYIVIYILCNYKNIIVVVKYYIIHSQSKMWIYDGIRYIDTLDSLREREREQHQQTAAGHHRLYQQYPPILSIATILSLATKNRIEWGNHKKAKNLSGENIGNFDINQPYFFNSRDTMPNIGS